VQCSPHYLPYPESKLKMNLCMHTWLFPLFLSWQRHEGMFLLWHFVTRYYPDASDWKKLCHVWNYCNKISVTMTNYG
jgi:hypothetical protein